VTLTKASNVRRSDMLRRMTDLLLASAASFPPEAVAIFNAVMQRLTQEVEPKALIELSGRLAAVSSAPPELIARLSQSDGIAVSGPMLEKSDLLTDDTLVGVAMTKGLGDLLSIAGRVQINDVVTDVLVDRGDPAVRCKVTANAGALLCSPSSKWRVLRRHHSRPDYHCVTVGRRSRLTEACAFRQS
jgi:uncharacterized protein (DUF2336 family)